MSDKRILAVTGATGAQGGGLVRAALKDPNSPFRVRALTRDPSSPKAKALADMGAELVQTDIDDPASLRRAFDGADAVYCVTFFWEHFDPEREKTQARNMAEAAKETGASHVVWSTLEDTRKRVPLDDDRMPSLGNYKVPHFDAKGEADAYFAALPTTYLVTSFYWDNFIHFGMGPQKGPDGNYAIAFPMGDKKLPGIAAADIGPCAYALLKDAAWVGKRVGIAGDHVTGAQMAEAMSRAKGVPIAYYAIEPAAYRALGFPGADDLGNMFQYKRDFNEEYCAARPIEATRKLHPGLLDFEGWLALHKDEIKLP